MSKSASVGVGKTPIHQDLAEGMETDIAALRLQALRKRGSGINLRNRPPTERRCDRILKLMGLTKGQHGAWAGFGIKEWIKNNPTWTEAEWVMLVAENFGAIQAARTLPG